MNRTHRILNFNVNGLRSRLIEVETLLRTMRPSVAVLTDVRLTGHRINLAGYSLLVVPHRPKAS